jgi:hypothetical protein
MSNVSGYRVTRDRVGAEDTEMKWWRNDERDSEDENVMRVSIVELSSTTVFSAHAVYELSRGIVDIHTRRV